MRIKSMPRFIFALTVLFVFISFLTSMFVNKVFSHEEPVYDTIVVCQGETLWSIASKLEGNVNENIYNIKKINSLNDANIYVGQELLVPCM